VIWALVSNETDGSYTSAQAVRTPGTLYAYDSNITLKWYSMNTFCASSMALPTVVHGKVFVPTYAAAGCPRGSGSAVTSGIVVYQ
jgi:hypothetical protein